MKGIYEFFRDYGRMGELESTFIADSEDVKKIVDKDIYFGEVLGKHSEVTCRIKEGDIILKTDDQKFISLFEQIMGEGCSTGLNPLKYYDWGGEEDEDEE